MKHVLLKFGKTPHMKKWLSICKIHTIVKVATSRKNNCSCEKIVVFVVVFKHIFDQKNDEKMKNNVPATKIDQKMVIGTIFCAKN